MAMHYIPIFLIFLSSFCKPDDQLTQTKSLTQGDTLVSESGDFALGFFSPTSSNKSFYFGIWYHSLPGPRTIVWVANRDNPITTPSSAMLTVTNDSHMVLSDSEGRHIWTTATSNMTATTAKAHAVLLNSGNFVLRLPNATDIWQSFDHPTDTILPTMRLLVSYKAKVVEQIIAWKGPDDLSSGDFSFSSDPSSPALQFIIWHGTRPYCRTSVLNDDSVIYGGTYLSNTRSVLYEAAVNSRGEFYVMFTTSDNSPFTRIMLDYTGMVKSLSWNTQSSSWALIREYPTAACNLYASCGPFSYCDSTQIIPACQCLDGFEPIGGIDFSKGCRRKKALKCGKESHFISMPGMKVPDKFLHIPNRSFDECAADCNRNCSCMAYAYANLSRVGVMADPSRCLVWSVELTDVGKATAGENLYF